MIERTWTRRILLATASVALTGGGIALPATAMAATPTTAPHSITTLAHQDDSADGIATSGDADAQNNTTAGTAISGDATTGSVGTCKGKCTITTGDATTGSASADATNVGDATAVTGDAKANGGKVNKKELKQNILKKVGKN